MPNITTFDYNGQVIQLRESDGYINLTQMCQANSKRIDKWKELKVTKAYIEELQQQYPEKGVLDSGIGGDHSGTWGHPSLAINLARWISPAFAVWCDTHIFNLMNTGFTSLSDNLSQPQQALPPKRDSIDFINAAEKLSLLSANEQLKRLLEDALVDDLSLNKTNETALTASQKEYTIVKVRAKELGYSIEDINAGTGLGRYVANRVEFAFKKRVGDYQVKHYAVTDDLDNTIHSYFNQRKVNS